MEAAKGESDPVVPKYAFPVLSPRLPPSLFFGFVVFGGVDLLILVWC